MAYAIFYNHQDLTAIAANVEATLANNYDQYLTVQERNTCKQTFQRAWTGGLSGWSTAPVAPLDRQEGDADTRIVIASGAQVTKAVLIAALNVIALKVPGAAYMAAIARDLAGESGCVEPWPPA
jgi:hypothetical protein